ncbi:MAG TPA: FtsX-like permease family protein, partial [Ktedonobacteraceae bacterium]|nr:FtsX-like permease family protein [Ktedonobacteraceae bacterium]
QDGSQPIAALTRELLAQRAEAARKNVIPALIDDAAAHALNLTVGQQFVLRDFHGPLNYRVVAIVHFIPTVYDSASSAGPDASISHGGILIDYQTDSVVALAINQETVSPTNVWLRTSNSPAALANVRHTLLMGAYALDNSADRRQLDAVLRSDPLYAALNGILLLGAAVSLLLGLSGNLVVSWLNARNRRGSFAILRALGSKPRQIASVLLWEQGIVYGSAILLGTILGLVFAWLILPAFIFSPLAGVDTADVGQEAFYLVQSVPAVHEIIPFASIAVLLAALVAVCTLVLIVIASIVLRPAVSQTLRVDED